MKKLTFSAVLLGTQNVDGPECENGNFSEAQKRKTSLASGAQKQYAESPSSQTLALEMLV